MRPLPPPTSLHPHALLAGLSSGPDAGQQLHDPGSWGYHPAAAMSEDEEYLAGWQAGTITGYILGLVTLGVLALLLSLGF